MENAVKLLQEHGLRNTPVRLKVLAYMNQHEHAISHADLETAIKGFADRVTLYRVLNKLEESGLVHKVIDRLGIARFALCRDTCSVHQHVDEHLHFQCKVCGHVYCLPIESMPQITLPQGFVLNNLQVNAEGSCARCRG